MTLPASVMAAEKFVEEFYKQPDAAASGNTDEAPTVDKPNDTAPAGEKETKPSGEGAPPTPDPKPEDETWKQKYDVLNGKYRAEVPNLHSKVKELEGRIAELTAKEEEAKAGSAAQEAASKKKEGLEAAMAKLKEEYGEEFIEHSRALARMEFEDAIRPLAEKLDGAQSLAQKLAEEKYLKTLHDKAPNWETIKDDPEFHEWLSVEDEFTGIRRFDLAKQAMLNGDAGRVAAFYNAFSKSKGGNEPASAPAPSPAESGKNKLVAPQPIPSNSTSRAASVDGELPIIRSSELARFARDVIAGKYEGRESEMKALEQKYNSAQAAGRIVMD